MEKWHIGSGDEDKVYAYFQDVARESNGNYIFCFDYFDTIVTRSVIPERTKVIAANQLSDLIGNQISGEEIYKQRQVLEIEICELNASKGFDPEFNIEQLAEKLFSTFKPKLQLFEIGYDKNSFLKNFIDIEIAVEKMVQRTSPEIIKTIKKLKEDNNTLILVSDFYLPAKYLRVILEEKNLLSFFDHLFISCDFLFTKNHSSKLYQVIQDKLGCEAGNMLMVGDNPHADIHAARLNGLNSVHVINREQQDYYMSLENTDTASNVKFQESLDRYKSQGPFSEMVTSFWLFIHRLVKRLQQEAIKDVVFFSKEGELLKALFDNYQTCVFGGERIKSHYLLISRKSTFLASLNPLPQEDFSRIFNYYRDISLGDFLLSLNFGLEWSENLCRSLSLPFNRRLKNLKNTDEFEKLVSAES
ncbi:MAG: HAD hydrolase-like protein, partial [Bacteroidetes bacterium]|nr:HAD hydrolase-like protein [Bacteroidota bacterium]